MAATTAATITATAADDFTVPIVTAAVPFYNTYRYCSCAIHSPQCQISFSVHNLALLVNYFCRAVFISTSWMTEKSRFGARQG